MLSCRILGREIEKVILAFIIEQAKKEGVNTLIGEFIPTKKNAPAKDVYKNAGFKLFDKKENIERWEIDIKEVEYHYPEFITVHIEV